MLFKQKWQISQEKVHTKKQQQWKMDKQKQTAWLTHALD